MLNPSVRDESLSKWDVCDIIVVEISRFVRKDWSGLINSVRDELISFMDKWLRILLPEWEADHLRT